MDHIILHATPLMLDLSDERAWIDDTPIALSNKPFRLLKALMQAPQRLVTKEELFEQVWDGRAVSDAVLTTAMRELRNALGDKARNPDFIETVHGRGYRFLKPVETDPEADERLEPQANRDVVPAPVASPASSSRLRRDHTTGAILIGIALIAAFLVWQFTGRGDTASTTANTPPSSTSIAVLAFDDISTEGNQEYFSDGVSEEILNSLVHLEGLDVAGRISSFSFKGTNTDIQTIGETLNVAHVLEGSIRTHGDTVRITAQLIKVEDGFHLWSEVYERDMGDIFAIQDEIAKAVAAELKIILTTDSTEPLVRIPTENEEAYRLFLQGRSLLGKRVGNNITEAIEAFEQAIALDPEFARAHSALAAAHAVQPDYRYDIDPSDAATAARGSAQRAIALDPTLAEPHAVLGLVAFDARDYIRSREAFDRASKLEPNNIDVLYWKAATLRSVGSFDEAAALSQRAVALDPVSPLGYATKATYSFAMGDLETAAQHAIRARDLGHPSGNYILAKIAELRGDGDLATRLHTESFADSGVSTWFSDEQLGVLLVGVYGSDEDALKARQLIDAYATSSAPKRDILAPNILLDLGEVEAALELFQESQTTLDQFFLLPVWSPSGKRIRQHPRFSEFVSAIGLVRYWDIYGWPDACHKISRGESTRVKCES